MLVDAYKNSNSITSLSVHFDNKMQMSGDIDRLVAIVIKNGILFELWCNFGKETKKIHTSCLSVCTVVYTGR